MHLAKSTDSHLEASPFSFKVAHIVIGQIRVYSLPLICPMFLFPPGSAEVAAFGVLLTVWSSLLPDPLSYWSSCLLRLSQHCVVCEISPDCFLFICGLAVSIWDGGRKLCVCSAACFGAFTRRIERACSDEKSFGAGYRCAHFDTCCVFVFLSWPEGGDRCVARRSAVKESGFCFDGCARKGRVGVVP